MPRGIEMTGGIPTLPSLFEGEALTLRDKIALYVLPQFVASEAEATVRSWAESIPKMVKWSYALADAMLDEMEDG